ncbi:MAG: formate dehydrogenase N subunit beta transmembrane domain-containing protein, partial [Lautropia sp.]|nr:formate dehydrogenase N subunit beta transmembrane domain-containing protein [Lautropia sp.]
PTISPLVSFWKGLAKPLAVAAMGAAALGSLFHYITKGPNEVSKELEDEMEEKDRLAAAEETARKQATLAGSASAGTGLHATTLRRDASGSSGNPGSGREV